jgi:nucleoside-diphosphate-sugar epimerase
MDITVIGGSGFIGSRLCQILEKKKLKKFNIIDKAVSNLFPNLVFISDVRSEIKLDNFQLGKVIINLAAEHRDDVSPRSLYDETNIEGAKNVCELANRFGAHTIIFTSTVAVYGFSPLNTNESGKIDPFNDYGRTKWEAENVYRHWQAEDPENKKLIIIRPTVVFGEGNRGNVYNLLKSISSKKFVMVGNGQNKKSIAYVDNLAAFLEYSMSFGPGVHLYNYVDKPDFTMNQLVNHVNQLLGKRNRVGVYLPYSIGILFGKFFDLLAFLLNKKFTISSIRVKKFCSNSIYDSSIHKTGFIPPIQLLEAINKTVRFEFY